MTISPNTHRQAFTLIELSVVLVIIGLIVGGIMGGQYLIKQAELQAIVTDLAKYKGAMTQFKESYGGKPGDLLDATDYWGTDPNGCPTHSTAVPRKETCNGDGDNLIETNENYRFWQQLSDAELIEGAFTGITSSGSADHALAGVNVPAGRLSGSAYHVFTNGVIGTSDANYFQHAATADLLFVGKTVSNSWPFGALLTPRQQSQLDVKMDDGKPPTGVMRSFKNTLNADCATTDTSAALYELTNIGTACTLIFFPEG